MLESMTGWLLEWLLHVVWMGLVVWVIAIAGDLYFKKRSPVQQYGWSLFCFGMLTLTLPLAAVNTQEKFVARVAQPVELIPKIDNELLNNSIRETDAEPAASGTTVIDLPRSEIVSMPKVESVGETRPLLPADRQVHPKQVSIAHTSAVAPNRLVDAATSTTQTSTSHAQATWLDPKWIAILYVLGCWAMFIRLLWAGANGLRLTKLASPIPDQKILAIVDQAAAQVGLALTPIVAACDRVAVPMVIGVWKPMVLLPLGILTELSSDQLQTILQHELMHLRRRDAWVVLGQRVVESVLFFHPATWWLSRRLDWLRELCCDDAVLALGTSPTEYARLLCHVAESSLNRFPAAGLVGSSAIGSNQSALVHRVRRILGMRSHHTVTPMLQCVVLAIAVCLPSLLLAAALVPGPNVESDPAVSTIADPPLAADNSEIVSEDASGTNANTYPEITGIVTDENGQPVAGATLIIREHTRKRGPYILPPPTDRRSLEILASTQSSASGEFKFENVKIPEEGEYVDSPYPITLIAMDHRFAVQWQHLDFIPKRAIEFKMAMAKPVRLQFFDSKNLPVDDATVKLMGWMTPEDWQWIHNREHISQPIFSPVDYADKGLIAEDFQDSLQPWVKSNQSSVAIQSPAGMISVVQVSAPNKIPETVYLFHSEDQPLQNLLSTNPNVPLFVSPISKRLTTAAKLRVTITDQATQAPIAGATIGQLEHSLDLARRTGRQQPDLSAFTSDRNGQIQLNNLIPDKEFKIGIEPPVGSNYLAAAAKSISLSFETQQELKFELETGVPITGRVLEAKSGHPIPGLKVTYAPLVLPKSDATFPTATTNNSGEYRLLGMASRGKIQLVDAPRRWRPSDIAVNVNPVESNIAPDLLLRQTASYWPEYMRFKVTYADGKPAKDAKVRFTEVSSTGSYSQDTKITDQNGEVNIDIKSFLYNDRRLFVHAVDQSQSFAGEVVYDLPKQIKNREDAKAYIKQLVAKKKSLDDPILSMPVKLQPMALLRGTALTFSTNQPVSRAVVRVYQNNKGKSGGGWRFVDPTETDDRGNYQVRIVPGLPYSINITHPNFEKLHISSNQTEALNLGESKDVTHKMVAKAASQSLGNQPLTSFLLPPEDRRLLPSAPTKPNQTKPKLTRTSNQHIPLIVVDENGNALPAINVDVWTEQQASNQGKKNWSILESLTSDNLGKIELYLPKIQDKYLWLVVNTKDGKGGFRKFHSNWFDPAKPSPEIVVKPLNQVTIRVTDHDTGDPIADCRVDASLRKEGFTFDRTMVAHTDSSGRCTLRGLIPDMYTRMEITKDGYHDFGSFSTDADHRRRNGTTGPFMVELLLESSYRRAVEAGKLSLPDVSSMKPADAFHTLTKHYDRAKKRRRRVSSHDSKIDRFYNRMKNFPARFYRDAVYQLAVAKTTGDETAFDAMAWLLSNGGESSDQYDQENAKFVVEFVERFANHDRLDATLEYIERYHPQPIPVFNKIISDHPLRRVRGNAANALAKRYRRGNGPYVLPGYPKKFDTTTIESNQQAERKLLNQILTDYADVDLTKLPSQTLARDAKKRLSWLQTYGIGSKPPVLSGETMSGAKISSKDFPGKFLVLHFDFKTSSPTQNAIRKINEQHADQVQVVGIIQGEFDQAKLTVQRTDVDWPVIWGGNEQIFSFARWSPPATRPNNSSWGKEKLYYFSRYSTIVISPTGEIIAIGRQGDALLNFVETSIKQTR